jgi:hypothetical protein
MTDPIEEADHVAGPTDGHGRRAQGVLQDKVPTDDPGEDLAQGRIGVGVSASRDRDERGELGIAQTGEGAGQAGQHERERDRRTGVLGRGMAGDDEDAGSYDGPHAEEDQMPGTEDAPESGAFGRRFPGQLLEALGGEQDAFHEAEHIT